MGPLSDTDHRRYLHHVHPKGLYGPYGPMMGIFTKACRGQCCLSSVGNGHPLVYENFDEHPRKFQFLNLGNMPTDHYRQHWQLDANLFFSQ